MYLYTILGIRKFNFRKLPNTIYFCITSLKTFRDYSLMFLTRCEQYPKRPKNFQLSVYKIDRIRKRLEIELPNG